MSSSTACLNITVDHRIQRLFIATQLPVGKSIPHDHDDEAFDDVVEYARQHIRALEPDEIDVTKRLARPYGVPRGILVLLQEPAETHEFCGGTAATIHSCATLQELHNIFHTVSHGTVGIADLNALEMQPSLRKQLQHRLIKTIRARSPAVAMCASRSFDKAGPLQCFASLGDGVVGGMLVRPAF
jgi:hypothetical protein